MHAAVPTYKEKEELNDSKAAAFEALLIVCATVEAASASSGERCVLLDEFATYLYDGRTPSAPQNSHNYCALVCLDVL